MPDEKKTILFTGHDLRFIQPFIKYCQANPCYKVLIEEHKGHVPKDTIRCEQMLSQADIIFCEWCLGNAVWYSQHKLPHQKIIVRLHLQELKLQYIDQTDWENVSALILICPFNYNLVREKYPFLKEKAVLIYNPIDCIALDQPKLPGAEFNLGLMGISPMRKAPHLAVKILNRMKKIDRRYTLYIKGKPPWEYDWLWKQPVERAYYEKLCEDIKRSPYTNSIIFETYGDDVPLWFTKIGFILSTSDFEGSHQSVAEGMASGAIPIIRNWEGADLLYPQRFVFSTIDEAIDLIIKWRQIERYQQEIDSIRSYAHKNFHHVNIIKQFEELLTTLSH